MKSTRDILQDWLPSGSVDTRFFGGENMIEFAEHYARLHNKGLIELIDNMQAMANDELDKLR